MKTLFLALALLPFAAAASRCADSPEAALSNASAAFAALGDFKAPTAALNAEPSSQEAAVVTASSKVQKAVLPKRSAPGAVKTLTLRGYVNLMGTGFGPRGSSYIMVSVSGYTQLQDQDGHALSGNIEFSSTDGYFVSAGMVSGWTHPYALVSVYDGGKLLGTARVEGSIFVSGFDNGGSVTLSGSGPVEGTLTYTAPAAQKP